MDTVFHNGSYLPRAGTFPAGNRGFLFGDGLFETMKIVDGRIRLGAYHFDRLFMGLRLLKIDSSRLSAEGLEAAVLALCQVNDCLEAARVRLTVYRSEETRVLIECFLLPPDHDRFNERGWIIDLFPDARKPMDAFANLKSCSSLPYTMAALYARENSLDDAIVLNTAHALCDASIANVFLVKDGACFTPALHQGCINGVMRRYLIEEIKKEGIAVHQAELREADLLSADEVFLTNAIRGIRWVAGFRNRSYECAFSKALYQRSLSTF